MPDTTPRLQSASDDPTLKYAPLSWYCVAAFAVALTVGVHLLGGRRTLLSVGAGTLAYVLLVNSF